MENKKFDINSIIGFLLIGAILIWLLYTESEKQQAETPKTTTEQVDKAENASNENVPENGDVPEKEGALAQTDSARTVQAQKDLGTFAYSASLPSATENSTVLENDLLQLKIANKGGQIIEAKMKKYKTHDSIPIYLVKDGNASFGLKINTKDGKTINTENLYFTPELSDDGNTLSMKLKISEDDYLEYVYSLRPGEYMLDFAIRSQGLGDIVNPSEAAILNWKMKAISHEKSVSYENRYTEIAYAYEDGKDDYTGQGDEDEQQDEQIDWVAFKQHFFTSILLADEPFDNGVFVSKNLVDDEEVDTLFTKAFSATMPLKPQAGEFSKSMNWYFGPADYTILNDYDRNLDEIISLGWGIFGWINKYIVIPFFNFLSGIMPAGIAIICLTILFKLLLSPVQYKQYLSKAKMKILRPEIEEIQKKYKDNAMKRQQETMALQSKAGASPLSGCLPALMQIPIFYALFMFFPSVFDLRNKSFLWVDDLSSYDVIAHLPFPIPFYGDHVSLLPILASVAIFFSMKLNSDGGDMMGQPTQEGMPDMRKMMKWMMYLSPIFMLFFFNNYASGLSLYYFVSNVITIGIILVIKFYIIDEEKVHAKIEEKKKKPKKQGRFSRKMKEIMEQAEEQKRMRDKMKK
jgi:YidC/Oxa1 family membrane protein insertase